MEMLSTSGTLMQDVLDRPVTAYIHRRFILLDEETNVAAGVRMMQQQKAETIIVTRDGHPLGIVTDSDILDKVVMKGEDSDQIYLKNVMTAPIVTLTLRGTVEQALQLMRLNQVKRVPVTDNQTIVGVVTQQDLANAIRTSVLERTFRSYRSVIREHYKPIIGNLGFVLQFAGILMFVPALVGTALGESLTVTGIYLAVVGLLSTGFILNSYGEKRPMSLKQASILIVSSFVTLSFFGSIPYMYINPFWEGIDPTSLFVNSFFESSSGFTTTGLSVLSNPELLPDSLAFYRSYTQWVGGLSFVYLVMMLFYPEKKLSSMRSILGGEVLRFKQLFVTVGIIFSIYTAALVLSLVFLSKVSNIHAISLVFSTVTGGGFIPVSTILLPEIQKYLILMSGMIISALPFAFHYSIFSKQARTRRMTTEVTAYALIIAAGIPIFFLLYNQGAESGAYMELDWLGSAFHVISGSTNTGFQFVQLDTIPSHTKIFLIIIMLVGGTAFSTAGGIKVGRFLLLFQKLLRRRPIDAPSSITSTANPPRNQPALAQHKKISESKENGKSKFDLEAASGYPKLYYMLFSEKAVRESFLVIVLFVFTAFVTGSLLSFLNQTSFEDGLFESVSALTTTGFTNGITSLDMDLFSKSLLVINMIIGRFEIIALLYIFFDSLRR